MELLPTPWVACHCTHLPREIPEKSAQVEAVALCAWDCLEDNPALKTIRELLAAVPDGKLLESLRQARSKGRNDDPVHVLWGVQLLTVLLRHPTIEACLAELRRNEGLRRVVGIVAEEGVPKKWNMSRFQEVLGQQPHRRLVKAVFDVMIGRLGEVVKDLRDRAPLLRRQIHGLDLELFTVPSSLRHLIPSLRTVDTLIPSPTIRGELHSTIMTKIGQLRVIGKWSFFNCPATHTPENSEKVGK